MHAGFRTIANKLNHILEEECFTWNTIFYYL